MNYLKSSTFKSIICKARCHLIYSKIKKHIFNDSKQTRICEIGPGRGDLAVKICQSQIVNEYCLVDIDQNVLDFVRKRLEMTESHHKVSTILLNPSDARINALDKFDFVVSSHVVEHTPDIRSHVGLIKDGLRQGGILYLASPNTDSLNNKQLGADWRAYKDDTHISLHSKKQMEKILVDAGFEIILSGTGGWVLNSFIRQGLDSLLWAANDDGDSYNILAKLKHKSI